MWDFPGLRFGSDSDHPVPRESGDLEAGMEAVASSLCRGQGKRTMCEPEFPIGIAN